MFRILVAVDGSESSDRAVAHLLKKLGWYKEKVEVHLLNVQAALPSDVSRFIPAATSSRASTGSRGRPRSPPPAPSSTPPRSPT